MGRRRKRRREGFSIERRRITERKEVEGKHVLFIVCWCSWRGASEALLVLSIQVYYNFYKQSVRYVAIEYTTMPNYDF